ncbi:PRKR-interacting protein 1 [Tolypocladium ophioglossoides CBS 100239]|uniref:PRKR-interacting protein 1 n=1 Tax=Tolypocladium ophioglossoides (strain CBS 100239) TaxID=1163406 RepID=A0A0L0NL40_TOLOC|nr:PRKR-interacting protein 1 [Tolypocladium ophioglossoides CBS 100239]
MSGEGPESIPTSADPRSRRPTKKRALTPSSAQAASLDALFAKPDREIRVPPPGAALATKRPGAAAPPEIVTNVQGSSAGAGSGEFHVYKASRRREYERLRGMDDELRREKEQEVFDKEKTERERRDEERTRKNREKREKMKARKAKKAKGGAGAGAAGGLEAATGAPVNPSPLGQRQSHGENDDQRDKLGDAVPSAMAQGPGLVMHDDDD